MSTGRTGPPPIVPLLIVASLASVGVATFLMSPRAIPAPGRLPEWCALAVASEIAFGSVALVVWCLWQRGLRRSVGPSAAASFFVLGGVCAAWLVARRADVPDGIVGSIELWFPATTFSCGVSLVSGFVARTARPSGDGPR